MTLKNSYTAPAALAVDSYHLDTPIEAYDLTFCFQVPSSLSTHGGVLIEPLIVTRLPSDPIAAQLTHFPPFSPLSTPLRSSTASARASLYSWFPIDAPSSLEDFLTFLEWFRANPGGLLFIIYDLSVLPTDSAPTSPTSPLRIAGIIGVLYASPQNRSTEIGPIIILPDFQRTHVLTHAVSLVLEWAFGALELRRVQWFANERNVGSVKAAERLGFTVESVLRWERPLPDGKKGIELPEWAREREERAGRGLGRHSIVLSIGWEEWETEGRAKVAGLVAREVKSRFV